MLVRGRGSAWRPAVPEAKGDYFEGVPDIGIEVLSPSNTASEMFDRERMCLENGGREFWIVDPDSRTLRITTADGRSRIAHEGESVSLAVLDAGEMPTASLFDS